MPKFYCEYCDLYLTHSGLSGRRQHLTGRRHINNKIEYYQNLIRDKGVSVFSSLRQGEISKVR